MILYSFESLYIGLSSCILVLTVCLRDFWEKDVLEEGHIALFMDVDASVIEAPGSPMRCGLHKLTPALFSRVPPSVVG